MPLSRWLRDSPRALARLLHVTALFAIFALVFGVFRVFNIFAERLDLE